MVEYIIGDTINAIANVSLGIGRSVAEYEWKWDNVSTGESIDEISYDTTNDAEGIHELSLRILNDCGNWSLTDTESINLIMPTGIIDVNDTYIQGDIITIGWSNVNFKNGRLVISDSEGLVKNSWIISTALGSVDYILAEDDFGTWYVELEHGTIGVDVKSFSIGVCPIPVVDITLV